jgi:hypothetical protein
MNVCALVHHFVKTRFFLLTVPLLVSVSAHAQSVTWPNGAGIPNYAGNFRWAPSYNASNPIPASFIPFASPGNIGSSIPGTGAFIQLVNHGPAGLGGSAFFGVGSGGTSTSTGQLNTAFGDNTLSSLSSGTQNTVMGQGAAYYLTSGYQNVAIGTNALILCTTCATNTAVGFYAMGRGAMTGIAPASGENTAVGWESMLNLTTGAQNSAVGENSMTNLTNGNYNSTLGADSQVENVGGFFNTSVGHDALYGAGGYPLGSPTCASGISVPYSASYNTAIGEGAFCTISTGNNNTVIGWQAGVGLTSGSGNVYVGNMAGDGVASNYANVSGDNNIYIGNLAGPGTTSDGPQYSNSIAIGYRAAVTASNQISLGNSATTQVVLPAGVTIESQDSGSPGLSFGPEGVTINTGGVTGTPSSIVARVPSALVTTPATVPLTSFYTTAIAGQYQICAQLSVKTAGAGTGSFSDVVAYTSDGNIIDVSVGGPVLVAQAGSSNFGISNNNVPNCFTTYIDAGSPIGWEVMAAGTISAAPTLRYGFTVTYLGL